jgi:cytochrome c oxidase assembly protein subunit 11
MNKNTKMAINLSMLVLGMLMLAYASVPLYKIFCQVTGFGGTTQVAEVLPTDIRERVVKVEFDTNVDSKLNWKFKADQQAMKVKVGENGLASYTVKNNSDKPMIGIASYNVTPLKAGQYFNKVYCFCFEEQTIAAGAEVHFPVSFFIEPAFDDDGYMDDVSTITLSYTFYEPSD